MAFAAGVTSGDANAPAGIGEVPENNPHPLAPLTRLSRHGSPLIPWRQLMDLMHLAQLMHAPGAEPLDPRDRGADQIR
ncbi:hypothetical protein [Streptomyces monashensis]|uniref:Uncharacterized protein n=1 Tax=Streptomyces monashensis TaxID=1678012 RepID=A0A1S2QPZ0_9ACTN|nr:hypothetical protein [Streptomyces monashensis]OIK07697.1 hypothetical protein BIV23_01555 [Streptomyces monashensis]